MKNQRKRAQRQSTAPVQHHINSNKQFWVCLILFIIFFACTVAGKTTNNEALKFFGLGVGFATLLFVTHENLTED